MHADRWVVFRVGDTRFALCSDVVDEALDEVRIEPLPAMPRHVRGLASHRGAWIPAIDAGALLDVGEGGASTGEPTAVLVVRRGGVRYALAVDAVESARLGEPEPFRGARVLRDEHGVAAVLDPDVLFDAELPSASGDAMQQTAPSAAKQRLLTMDVGSLRCAADVARVEEVLPFTGLHPVDGDVPPHVAGAADVRGASLHVLDLRTLLGEPAAEPTGEARLVVAGLGERRVALLVDRVDEVIEVDARSVVAAPGYLRRWAPPSVVGVVEHRERLRLVIALDALLRD